MRFAPWLALLVACSGGQDVSEYADTTLPPGSVGTDLEFESTRRDFQGTLSVSGDPGQFTLSTQLPVGGRVTIDVNSPSGADLSPFDGQENVRFSIGREPLSDRLSVLLADDDGPIYLFETIQPTVLTTSTFAAAFIAEGQNLGTTQSNNTILTLRSAILNTDDGDVEAFPGEPVDVEAQNNMYRFVLDAYWTRAIPPNVGVSCLTDSILSFEMVRIIEPSDTTPIERSGDVNIDGNDCAAAALGG